MTVPETDAANGRPGPKPSLTLATVVEAALELIDAEGVGALNFRKLSAKLGVSAMTPYGYVADKTALLNEMIGHALSAVRVDPNSAEAWDLQLERAMSAMHDALERHPAVIELIMTEDPSGAGRLEQFRTDLIAMLTRAGFTREQSVTSLRTLTSYVLGYTMLTRLRRRAGPRRAATAATFAHGLGQLMDAIRREAALG